MGLLRDFNDWHGSGKGETKLEEAPWGSGVRPQRVEWVPWRKGLLLSHYLVLKGRQTLATAD